MTLKSKIVSGVVGLGILGAVFIKTPYPQFTLPPQGWGNINTNVTQNNISSTICTPNWTKTIRPPSNYTTSLKKNQLTYWKYKDQDPKNYEEDHVISLELGGNPTDAMNLWPEPYTGEYNAHMKDQLENYLHSQVCAGAMKLVDAQKQISTDWVTAYKQMKITTNPSTSDD